MLVRAFYKLLSTIKEILDKKWPASVFWVSRFKQNTNIPIGNHFPGLAWKSLVPQTCLKHKTKQNKNTMSQRQKVLKRKENLKKKKPKEA